MITFVCTYEIRCQWDVKGLSGELELVTEANSFEEAARLVPEILNNINDTEKLNTHLKCSNGYSVVSVPHTWWELKSITKVKEVE